MTTPSKPGGEDNLILTAFDSLFNKRDYASAEPFWSPRYIQHGAHIPPGREGLFDLVKSLPATLRYENIAAATGDFVILHGRFSCHGLPAGLVMVTWLAGLACDWAAYAPARRLVPGSVRRLAYIRRRSSWYCGLPPDLAVAAQPFFHSLPAQP
jgi:hypothetical protein